MTDDQRFAARRPDVLVFETERLTDDTTLAGEILAQLQVSTSGTDADWIVKVIDVFPNDEPETARDCTIFKNEQLPHDGAKRSDERSF